MDYTEVITNQHLDETDRLEAKMVRYWNEVGAPYGLTIGDEYVNIDGEIVAYDDVDGLIDALINSRNEHVKYNDWMTFYDETGEPVNHGEYYIQFDIKNEMFNYNICNDYAVYELLFDDYSIRNWGCA